MSFELLTPYGRRDSPPPASDRWPNHCRPTVSAVGHRSLPAASFRPAPRWTGRVILNSQLKTKNSKLRYWYPFNQLRDGLKIGGVAAFEEFEEG